MGFSGSAGGKSLIGISLFVAAIVGLGIYGALRDNDGPRQADTLKNPAVIICQHGVSRALKSPGSADFPLLDFTARYIGGNSWVVSSYVDSENSFGATVRTNWTCRAKYITGDPLLDSNWQIEGITTK